MTRIVLDIPNSNDVELLLPLLRRLGIIISNQNHELSESEIIYHKNIIDKGGRNIENFEGFIQDFELSRQDRPMPFRD
jgi:hypothetical protein